MIDYAAAGDLLEAYGAAWETFDGDAWVAIFAEDAEYHEDPFGAPLVGHNALRAFMLERPRLSATSTSRSSATGCRARRSSRRGTLHGSRGRTAGAFDVAGFMTAEVADDGRISRFHEWRIVAPGPRG